jgi:DNA-binding response OmpR family regulator
MARIAIIDDHEDTLELLRLVLQNHQNHEFVAYGASEEFLRQFRPRAFDLVLVDLHMPGCDGFETFWRIRERDDSVPVVAVTAQRNPKEKDRALRAGFCDYFVKPILDLEEFRAKIYSHIGKCSDPPYQPKMPAA